MKLLIIIAIFLGSCATVDERIKDYSYTTARYIDQGVNYQVYTTKKGSLYIIKLNKRETKFKRVYL